MAGADEKNVEQTKDMVETTQQNDKPQYVAAGNEAVGRFAVFSTLLDWSDALKTPSYYDQNGNNGVILVDLSEGVKEAWDTAARTNKHPSEAAIDMLIITEDRRGHKFTKRHTKLNDVDVWFAEDDTGDNEYGLFYSMWYIITENKFLYINISGKTKEQYTALRDVFASTYKMPTEA